jgi:hypothetical protein
MDPIGDLCRLIKRLPRDAQERFINTAAVAVGHPGGEATVVPDAATGETKDVATTLDDLESWLRHLVKDSHFDDKFLVCGLLHDVSEGQRIAATQESRAQSKGLWLGGIGEMDGLLQTSIDDRPGHVSDAALLKVRSECEEEVGNVDAMCDDALAAHVAIERERAATFDDSYWRAWTLHLVRIAMGDERAEEPGATK